MKECPYCYAEVKDDASKCRFCGEWLTGAKTKVISTRPGTTRINNPQNVTVVMQNDNSIVFPLITVIGYLITYPVGLVLNIIGLITGPRKGCFLSLFIVFFLLPLCVILLIIVIVLMSAAIDGIR